MRILASLGMLAALACAARADILVSGSFGSNGDVGFGSGPSSITFGDGHGSIFQMDAFINVDGSCDFGTAPTQTQDLLCGAPAGIGYTFSASQPNSHQLLLNYQFVNNTGAALPGFDMVYFVNPEIGSNTSNNSATVGGSLGKGVFSYEVGDPTYSSIFYDEINNTLSDANARPSTNPGETSMALDITAGTLSIGAQTSFQILLSDNGSSIGSLHIAQSDPGYAGDILTVSGMVTPEPSTIILLTSGLAILLLRKRLAGIL